MHTRSAGIEVQLLDLLLQVERPELGVEGAGDAVQQSLQLCIAGGLGSLTPLCIPLLSTAPAAS